MLIFILNIVFILFSAAWMIWVAVSRKKAIKSIEKEKGEILYTSGNAKWEKFYYIVIVIFFIFVVVNFIIEKPDSISAVVMLINIMNFANLTSKRIITAKGIGFQSPSNILTKFIAWDTIKDIHWNKFEPNKLCVTYLYVDTIRDLELKFKNDEIESINGILEKYGYFE